MNTLIPRLRMFAGPNGSGKSTLKSYLPGDYFGVYINPDEVEQEIRAQGVLDLSRFQVATTTEEVSRFFDASNPLAATGLRAVLVDGRLDFSGATIDSYVASAVADFLRQALLGERLSFTFETVMSHPGKVAILERAQEAGYRTYLYYIATDDPAINISRVRHRVELGGHPVPHDKITSRYYRSLDQLADAIKHSHRAYVFDNSGNLGDHTWLAEITDGTQLELKSERIPAWFKRAVMDKMTP